MKIFNLKFGMFLFALIMGSCFSAQAQTAEEDAAAARQKAAAEANYLMIKAQATASENQRRLDDARTKPTQVSPPAQTQTTKPTTTTTPSSTPSSTSPKATAQ